jgi:uracil-DNA glycosylase family protein
MPTATPTTGTAEEFVPATHTLTALRAAAEGCRGCELYRHATQTVFGEGRAHAPLFFVGEQPGDREDRAGEPFVGPAGKLLRTTLVAVGIAPADAYITNAVKHFKFVERGKRRIHQAPKRSEVKACRPWLEAELDAIKPKLVVALGATAAQSLLGASFKLTPNRGKLFAADIAPHVIATVHPSSILRAIDDEMRHQQLLAFRADLMAVSAALKRIASL